MVLKDYLSKTKNILTSDVGDLASSINKKLSGNMLYRLASGVPSVAYSGLKNSAKLCTRSSEYFAGKNGGESGSEIGKYVSLPSAAASTILGAAAFGAPGLIMGAISAPVVSAGSGYCSSLLVESLKETKNKGIISGAKKLAKGTFAPIKSILDIPGDSFNYLNGIDISKDKETYGNFTDVLNCLYFFMEDLRNYGINSAPAVREVVFENDVNFEMYNDKQVKSLEKIVKKVKKAKQNIQQEYDGWKKGNLSDGLSGFENFAKNKTQEFKDNVRGNLYSVLEKYVDVEDSLSDMDKLFFDELNSDARYDVIKKLFKRQFDDNSKEYKQFVKKKDNILEQILPDAYALVQMSAKEAIGLEHYDEQILAGISQNQGKIIKMRTGEGKTLTSALPIYLNALAGQSHWVTRNEYDSQRDFDNFSKLFDYLGLRSSLNREDIDNKERKRIFADSDVIFSDISSVAFTYLRNTLAKDITDIVNMDFNYANVDEFDQITIDNGLTPFVIDNGNKSFMSDMSAKIGEICQYLYDTDMKKGYANTLDFDIVDFFDRYGPQNMVAQTLSLINHVKLNPENSEIEMYVANLLGQSKRDLKYFNKDDYALNKSVREGINELILFYSKHADDPISNQIVKLLGDNGTDYNLIDFEHNFSETALEDFIGFFNKKTESELSVKDYNTDLNLKNDLNVYFLENIKGILENVYSLGKKDIRSVIGNLGFAMQGGDFISDKANNYVMLTEIGTDKIQSCINEFFESANLPSFIPKAYFLQKMDLALRVNELMEDTYGIIEDSEGIPKIRIYDSVQGEFKHDNQKYSEGMNQALEAKVFGRVLNKETEPATKIMVHYLLGLYDKFSGQTGTPSNKASYQIFNKETVDVPTHFPDIRVHHPEKLYATKNEKIDNIIEKVKETNLDSNPCLIICESDKLSLEIYNRIKDMDGVDKDKLNLFTDFKAQNSDDPYGYKKNIVKKAGMAKEITVATNMGGRAIDIPVDNSAYADSVIDNIVRQSIGSYNEGTSVFLRTSDSVLVDENRCTVKKKGLVQYDNLIFNKSSQNLETSLTDENLDFFASFFNDHEEKGRGYIIAKRSGQKLDVETLDKEEHNFLLDNILSAINLSCNKKGLAVIDSYSEIDNSGRIVIYEKGQPLEFVANSKKDMKKAEKKIKRLVGKENVISYYNPYLTNGYVYAYPDRCNVNLPVIGSKDCTDVLNSISGKMLNENLEYFDILESYKISNDLKTSDSSTFSKDITPGLTVIHGEKQKFERAEQQAIGRTGRQGQQGSTYYFSSLDDSLLDFINKDSSQKILSCQKALSGHTYGKELNKVFFGQRKGDNFNYLANFREQMESKNLANLISEVKLENYLEGDRKRVFEIRNDILRSDDKELSERISENADHFIDRLYGSFGISHDSKHKDLLDLDDYLQSYGVDIDFSDAQSMRDNLRSALVPSEQSNLKQRVLNIIDFYWRNHMGNMNQIKHQISSAKDYGKTSAPVSGLLFDRIEDKVLEDYFKIDLPKSYLDNYDKALAKKGLIMNHKNMEERNILENIVMNRIRRRFAKDDASLVQVMVDKKSFDREEYMRADKDFIGDVLANMNIFDKSKYFINKLSLGMLFPSSGLDAFADTYYNKRLKFMRLPLNKESEKDELFEQIEAAYYPKKIVSVDEIMCRDKKFADSLSLRDKFSLFGNGERSNKIRQDFVDKSLRNNKYVREVFNIEDCADHVLETKGMRSELELFMKLFDKNSGKFTDDDLDKFKILQPDDIEQIKNDLVFIG